MVSALCSLLPVLAAVYVFRNTMLGCCFSSFLCSLIIVIRYLSRATCMGFVDAAGSGIDAELPSPPAKGSSLPAGCCRRLEFSSEVLIPSRRWMSQSGRIFYSGRVTWQIRNEKTTYWEWRGVLPSCPHHTLMIRRKQ